MIIIINGCPSVGKTSLIKEIQNQYPTPLLNMGIDRFWGAIPNQYKEYGSHAQQGYSFEKASDNNGNPIISVKRGLLLINLQKPCLI